MWKKEGYKRTHYTNGMQADVPVSKPGKLVTTTHEDLWDFCGTKLTVEN